MAVGFSPFSANLIFCLIISSFDPIHIVIANRFFRYGTCSKNINPPTPPLFQRGEFSGIHLKVPL
jgi:hypothetical protein